MNACLSLERRDLIHLVAVALFWLKMAWAINRRQASFVSFPTSASGRGCCGGMPAYRHAVHSCTSVRPLPPSRRAMVRLMDMQSFRDGFRALFLPGCAVVTLTLPLLSVLLLTRTLDFSACAKRWRFDQPQASRETVVLFAKLLFSIAIDLIGDGSFLLPGLGEGTDFLWAPISALLVRALYGSNVLAAVNFVEELLPGTDVLPTATIAFVLDLAFNQPPDKTEPGEPLTDVHGSIRTDRKQ